MIDSDLTKIGKACKTDKATHHGYTEIYHELFSGFRHDNINLLELGVADGRSLKMWRRYFPNARVCGVDIAPEQIRGDEQRKNIEGCDVIEADCTRPFVGMDAYEWDIIVDDASHSGPQIVQSFDMLWPFLKSGGWYAIEDLQVAKGLDLFFNEVWQDITHFKLADQLILWRNLALLQKK